MNSRRSFFRGVSTAMVGGLAVATASFAAPLPGRPKRMIHLEVGNERWEPTQDELDTIVKLFQEADLNPQGAIIATRDGVKVTIID